MATWTHTTQAVRATASAEPRHTSVPRAGEREGIGWFAKLVAIGFWGTLATLIVSAAVVPGFIVLALLPLAGLPYLVFCFIALTGDRNVE
jgi:hypothetical protein